MKLKRDFSLKINWIFDQLIPPILRDCRWFMYIPIKMAFRHRANLFLDFKSRAHNLTPEEYEKAYKDTSDVSFERETDLNHKSIELILSHLAGQKVLEVGCGAGYLSRLIADKNYDVTAVDIIVPETSGTSNLKYQKANIEALPFGENEFDTVVCTHTLEHVLNFNQAVSELRRVGKKLLIIVPKQRPYKYTFDLHINFFPYKFSFVYAMGKKDDEVICINADGDIFYVENKN